MSDTKVSARPAKAAKGAAGTEKTFSLSSLLKDSGWSSALESEMEKDYFKSLEALLDKGYCPKASSQTFPSQDLIFSAFNLTPLKQVIIGCKLQVSIQSHPKQVNVMLYSVVLYIYISYPNLG